uniref:Peptidase M12B domain-containing protein n=1 Tax=Romanomermis culicivorax TaxID=13658 RepID=A0A915K2K8_ROMCU
MGVFVDSVLWDEYQRNHGYQAESKLTDFVKSIIHNHSLPITSYGSRYLDYFCNYQATMKRKGQNWDVAVLMTGFVLAHELGHNLGMNHDEDMSCASDHVMSTFTGAGKVKWSSCSTRSLQQFLYNLDRNGNNCLRRTSAYKHNSFYLSSFSSTRELPGRIYDANEQCRQFYGPGYSHYSGSLVSVDVCHMIYCHAYGLSPISSHPALEGTICGRDRHCKNGRCVTYSYYEAPSNINSYWSSYVTASPNTPSPSLSSYPSTVKWTAWSQWSQCAYENKGCMKARTRACISIPTIDRPSTKASGCPGVDSESEYCDEYYCPNSKRSSWQYYPKKQVKDTNTPGSSWGQWSSCTASCDSGIQVRYKGGYYPDQETRTCNMKPCSYWGGWGDWSDCGSNRKRRRLRRCYGNGRCQGETEESVNC